MATLVCTPGVGLWLSACAVCPSIWSTLWVSRPLMSLILNAICLVAPHQEAKSITLVQQDTDLGQGLRVGPGSVELRMPINTFKCPHPTPPAWDGFWAWGLHPKNPSWEISKAASVLLKSLGIVASRGQVVPNVLQVLHISQNAIYACLQWAEVAPLPMHSLLQLWHQRPQLAVDLGLGSKKLLLQ